MIIVIRISGLVEVSYDVEEILQRLRLRRKYSAILLKNTKENMELIRKVRNFVAYGTLDDKDIIELITKRGKVVPGKKLEPTKVLEHVKAKGLNVESGIKPFFRLHPPRGGIDSKIHYPVKHGVLGDHGNKINELLRRML